MDKVTPVFAVARASPEGTKLCDRWVSDEQWTSAVNFTTQENLTTTKLFNRSMSNAFMDLECFNCNHSGVFRVRYKRVFFYYITDPGRSIVQPIMTPDWFQETILFCESITFNPTTSNGVLLSNTKHSNGEITITPSDRKHWQPDQSSIVYTKRTTIKIKESFYTYDYMYKSDNKSLSAMKGHANHDEKILSHEREKINHNNQLLVDILSMQSCKRKKEQEKEKLDTSRRLRLMGKEIVGKRSLQVQASTLIEQVLKAYGLKDLPKTISQKYYAKYFPAWKIGLAMDRHVGALNFQEVDSIRSVQGLEKYEKGIIPFWSL